VVAYQDYIQSGLRHDENRAVREIANGIKQLRRLANPKLIAFLSYHSSLWCPFEDSALILRGCSP
jgi:hypothetical protein